jgi:hypothetical protein
MLRPVEKAAERFIEEPWIGGGSGLPELHAASHGFARRGHIS